MQYNDEIKFVVPQKPTGYTTSAPTITIPAGNDGQLYVNGTLVWTAGAGSGLVNNATAPNAITSVIAQGSANRSYGVHWHSGDGKSGATHSNSFPLIFRSYNPGGCYGGDGHTHDAPGLGDCSWRYTYHEHTEACKGERRNPMRVIDRENGVVWCECTICGNRQWRIDSGETSGWAIYSCDANDFHNFYLDHCTNELNAGFEYTCGSPTNTWSLHCGYSQGQIVGINNDNANLHSCYYASGWNPDSAVITNSGNAKFTIKLVEQEMLYYKNIQTKSLNYLNAKCNLVILDNTVAYFKRP